MRGAHEVTIMAFTGESKTAVRDKSKTATDVDFRVMQKKNLSDLASGMVGAPEPFASGNDIDAYYLDHPGKHGGDSSYVLTRRRVLEDHTIFLKELQEAPPYMQERYVITQFLHNDEFYSCAIGKNLGTPLDKFLDEHEMLSTSALFSIVFEIHKEFKRLHQAGFIHTDPYHGNVLVRFDDKGELCVTLIDVGGIKKIGISVKRSLSKNGFFGRQTEEERALDYEDYPNCFNHVSHVAPEGLKCVEYTHARLNGSHEDCLIEITVPMDQKDKWTPTAAANVPGEGYLFMLLSEYLPETEGMLLYELGEYMMQPMDPASRMTFSEIGADLERIRSSCIPPQQVLAVPAIPPQQTLAPTQRFFGPSMKQSIADLTQEQPVDDSKAPSLSVKARPARHTKIPGTTLATIQEESKATIQEKPKTSRFSSFLTIFKKSKKSKKASWGAVPTSTTKKSEQHVLTSDDDMPLAPTTTGEDAGPEERGRVFFLQ